MKDLKDFFTININCRLFVPTIIDDGLRYSIMYDRNNSIGITSFCIVKRDRTEFEWKQLKRGIQDSIYLKLKESGVY